MTDEWQLCTLGDELELSYGRSLPAQARRPGRVPVFGSNGIVGTHDASAVPGPGIIVGRKGSVGETAFSSEPFWPIDTTYFVVNKSGHNWRFLFHLLRNCGLTKLNTHSAVPGLNRESVYSIPAVFPPRAEQHKIAEALDFIENSVIVEEQTVSETEALKRAAMRELFTRGLRGETQKETEIGLVPESWNIVDFGNVREWLQYGTSVRCSLEPARYPVLRIPNIEPSRVNAKDLKYCDLRPSEADNYRLERGDLIFIRTNGVLERLGSCAVYTEEPAEALFASYLIRARLRRKIVEPSFAAYFFGSQKGTELIASRATPAADGKYNLNTGTIESIPLPVPPNLDEQREIAAVLHAIDRKIDLHRRRRAILEELFKALLHKLMTGEIRVADLDLSATSGFCGDQSRFPARGPSPRPSPRARGEGAEKPSPPLSGERVG